MSEAPEAWLSGPVAGVVPHLMPVAHSLLQTGRDLEGPVADFSPEEVWARPGGAASLGFHLQHIAGVLDRLCAYARGEVLSDAQLRTLRSEGQAGEPPGEAARLVADARAAIGRALDQVRTTAAESLLEPRAVGRKRLPSTVLGLLYHAAEHAARHAGQIVTTARVLRGGRQGGAR